MGSWSRRPPVGALAALLAVLALGPLGVVAFGRAPGHARPSVRHDATLAGLARTAGCRFTEYGTLRATNPTTGGVVANERVWPAPMRSYVGRRSPGVRPALHALMHGGVLIQYRPGLPAGQVARLSTLARVPSDRALVYENTTGMRAPVVATAYLAMVSCPRVDAGSLKAIQAFRDRRRDFGLGI
jgi:hypothetical protein